MKISAVLLAIFLPVVSYAQLPDQSRVYAKDGSYLLYEASEEATVMGLDSNNAALMEKEIPEGFGGLNIGTFSGGTEAQANLFRYNIHYSAQGSLPLYIFATTPLADDNPKGTAINSLLGTDSGLLNIKIADDTYTFNNRNGDGKGVCDFQGNATGTVGGCYLNSQIGIKLIDYLNEDGKSKQLSSIYASAQFSFDFPITESAGGTLKRAGRLSGGLGLSGYYANTNRVEHLFPELDIEAGEELKKFYASFDAGLSFTIDDQFSISATLSKSFLNDDSFGTVTSINFNWIPNAK